MICLQLFLTFFQIGAVSFGGGFGMLALIRESVLSFGWMTEEEFLNLIAVSESTPGPIAVNIATFIGSTQAGLLGAFCATLGVVLPAFLIILLIAALLSRLMQYAGVKAVLGGIRPAVAGLVLSTALTMFLSGLFGVAEVGDMLSFDGAGAFLFAALTGISLLFVRIRKRAISPIFLIVLSALAGMLLYG